MPEYFDDAELTAIEKRLVDGAPHEAPKQAEILALIADLRNARRERIELTPSLTCMEVLATTDDAVYVRLPPKLRRGADGCSCDECKRETNPDKKDKWDTLLVPIRPASGKGKREFMYSHTSTVHMPDASVARFIEYFRQKKNAR